MLQNFILKQIYLLVDWLQLDKKLAVFFEIFEQNYGKVSTKTETNKKR